MVALDSNVFIYALEGNPRYGQAAAAALRQAQGQGFASEFVYLELLSKRDFKDAHKREIVIAFLDTQKLEFIELNKEILLKAASLRAELTPKIGVGDAIHLASAIHAGANTFITNDQDLVNLRLSNLKIVGLG